MELAERFCMESDYLTVVPAEGEELDINTVKAYPESTNYIPNCLYYLPHTTTTEVKNLCY